MKIQRGYHSQGPARPVQGIGVSFLVYTQAGIRACRSAKRMAGYSDTDLIAGVTINPWDIKPTTLATRVLPRKSLAQDVRAPPTVLPIRGGRGNAMTPAITAGPGTPALPATPALPQQGPQQPQGPQPPAAADAEADQKDDEVDSGSHSTDNPHASDPNTSELNMNEDSASSQGMDEEGGELALVSDDTPFLSRT